MKPTRIEWKWIAIAAVAAFLPLPMHGDDGGRPKTVTFTFAPPDGIEYVQTLVTTRERIFDGTERQIDRSESEVAIVIDRVEDGYRMTAKPTGHKMVRDGKPVTDPISQMLQRAVATYRIDEEGQVRSIEGFGGLLDGIKDSLPPDVLEALAPMINEDALVAREVAEWNGRIGDFAGAEVTIGETIEGETPFTLPNGESMTYLSTTTFPGFRDCPAGSCVVIEIEYDSNAEALEALTVETVTDVVDAVGGIDGGESDDPTSTDGNSTEPASGEAPASSIQGTVRRLIDPETMLIYEETVTRTIRMTMDIPGAGATPVVMNEDRIYRFRYGD